MTSRKLGRLPNDPSKPRLKLNTYLTALEVKDKVDYFSNVESWPMYANDRIGDCTCAGVGHIIESVTQYGQGTTVTIPEDVVINAYSAVSGYDPATGANDNGAVMQDVLNYWRKTGFNGHKILAFAELNLNNLDAMHQACELFGNVYLGIDFPAFAMDQFDAGQPWDVQSQNANLEGGHAINGGWYDKTAGMWKVITWGQVQGMTQAFFDKYVEEAWVAITPEWVEGSDSPEGIDLATLNYDYEQITGQPGPFAVEPTPPPNPEPNPQPAPEPDNAFDELVKIIQKIIKEFEDLFFNVKKVNEHVKKINDDRNSRP